MKSLQVIHTPEIRDSRNQGHPTHKSLTPGDGSLMPPAIQSGRSTRSRKNPQAVFIALPGLCLVQPLKPHAKPRRREEIISTQISFL